MPCHSYGTTKYNRLGDKALGITAHGYQTAAKQYLGGVPPSQLQFSPVAPALGSRV